ncbi:MAG: AAA family ATPase [bacterium]
MRRVTLEALACTMGLLGQKSPKSYGLEDLDKGDGRIQLDISMRCRWQGENRRVVLSIHAGHFGSDVVSLHTWDSRDQSSLADVEAESWNRLWFYGRTPVVHSNDKLTQAFLAEMNYHTETSPDGFNESTIPVPTVLSFPAYRDIPPVDNSDIRSVAKPAHWNYQSLHRFSAHNETWLYSLDSLLVWLKWLDDGRFEKARDLLNEQVFQGGNKFFRDIQRDPPQAVIDVAGERHRLDQLSSGEKNIAQLMLRIGAHMTQNTIILIDEFDVHLHIRWQYHLFEALKALAARQDINITVILTTHSVEVLETYTSRLNIKEDGLIKGGHLIEKGLRQE